MKVTPRDCLPRIEAWDRRDCEIWLNPANGKFWAECRRLEYSCIEVKP